MSAEDTNKSADQRSLSRGRESVSRPCYITPYHPRCGVGGDCGVDERHGVRDCADRFSPPFSQFGRGGFGNMRPSSTSRDRDRDISSERGRGANRILSNDGIDAVPEDSIP